LPTKPIIDLISGPKTLEPVSSLITQDSTQESDFFDGIEEKKTDDIKTRNSLLDKPIRECFILNMGGEGEIEGPLVINQQISALASDSWSRSRDTATLAELREQNVEFVICDNRSLPFRPGVFDLVYTDGVPLDFKTFLGPGVQSSEARRMVKEGGLWIHNGAIQPTEPKED